MNSQEHIPLYKRLTDYYRRMIILQEIKPGEKIDSINRIMSRHSVSRETAKRVIKILTDENLVVSQAGKGTYATIASTIVECWGMVVPFYSSNTEQLILHLNLEAVKQNRKLDYFLHYNNPGEEKRTVGRLIRKGYEAIIIVPNYDESNTGEFYRNLNPGKTKIILADNTMAGSYFKYAIQSYDLGVKRAVDYLTKDNIANYLLLSSERWQGKNLVFELMKQTFEMMLEINLPESVLYHSSDINKLTPEYIKSRNIRGVLSVQDSITIRLIGRLRNGGVTIPDDIRIVSYGNTELTEFFSPAITAINCKYDEMAKSISELIYQKGNHKKAQVVIQPELIIRHT